MSLQLANQVDTRCSMTRQYTYEIDWIPENHYVAGTSIELRSCCLRAFHSWRYVRMEMENGDMVFRCKVAPSPSEMWANSDFVIMRAVLQYGAVKGERYRIRLVAVPPHWAGIDENLSVWTIDAPSPWPRAEDDQSEARKEEDSECRLAVRAAPVERLAVYSHPTPGPQGTVRTCIVPQDRYGNPSAFNTTVTAELSWCGQTQAVALQQSKILDLEAPSDIGRVRLSLLMDTLSPQENIQNGSIEGDRIVVMGNPVWANLPSGLKPAFGEIHWHTELSDDGQRSITEAIRSARDYLNMDFVAPGDHSPRGKAWEETVDALEAANEPDEFATLFGWEHGSAQGHQNYYFTDPYHPVRPDGKAKITDAVSDVVETLRQHQDFIAVPHHTNAVAETRSLEDDRPFWHPYPWGKPEVYLRLVEIIQSRGNQERNVYDDVWRGWHQNNNASVQDALAHGHTLGFTGGTDNHCGWPGQAYAHHEGAGLHPPCSVILTGVWTERIERQSIFEALYDRHTWAVWDTRALVWFTVNDILGGGELEMKAGEPLKAHIKLSATAPLQSVEIVSEGESVWIDSFAEMDIDVEVPLGQAQTSTYFYLRALQRDGGIIYASPVFVAVSDSRRTDG